MAPTLWSSSINRITAPPPARCSRRPASFSSAPNRWRAPSSSSVARRQDSVATHRHSAGRDSFSRPNLGLTTATGISCRPGVLIEKKGLATSLRAFALFKESIRPADFHGRRRRADAAELQALARELGIEKQVRFAGFLSQAQLREEFLPGAPFSASERTGRGWKPGGRAELDARSDGERSACFCDEPWRNSGGDRGWSSGVLVDEGDHAALARALLDWTSRPAELSRLAQAGAQAVAEKFEQRAQARVLEDFYSEALES